MVDNTGHVTTSNGGSGQSEDTVCVNPPAIQILKKADASSVNAGDQVGFTITVYNTGAGDAHGVKLNDTLPTNTGLSWSIDTVTSPPGAGWAGSCAITAGVLNCGGASGVTVAHNTTLAGSTFTVHIVSGTTKDTAGPCPGSGVVDNTGHVSTSNDGSGQSEDTVCVNAPNIQILKKADAAQVNAGDQVGFTITVYNSGLGDAYGVKLNDTLPANAGLSWSIDTVTSPPGAGWAGSCAITAGVLNCGGANGVTVPAGTLLAGSSFTVHIISSTTKDTAGPCPGSGVVDNTGHVTTSNDGSGQSEDTVCVNPPGIQILKKADASQVNAGDQVGFTITVYNTGAGDAQGVKLNDTLPTNAGLSWSIDTVTSPPGSGWNGTCAITAGVLNCGGTNGVTVPHNTTLAASSFTVHIISSTTSATGGPCPGTGLVDNTGHVTTSNGGSGQSEDTVCVNPPNIQILKKADAAQVDAGDQIGFTITIYNTGAGDAHGVKLNDTLPVKSGLSWTIDTVVSPPGAGWAGSCAITAGVLNCGGANGVTVPHNTTLAGSTFTVHITSQTTAATGGTCPGGTGVVTNTGNVTTTNDGSGQSSASTCVAKPGIGIMKKADAAQVNAGDPIGFTLTVYNTGTGNAKGVKLTDTLPVKSGLSWTIAGQGAGWGGSCAIAAGVLTCGPATVPAGTTLAASTFTVHVTSPTTAATGGVCPGGSGVVNNTGNVTTTNDGSGSSSASTCVAAPAVTISKTADHSAPVNAGDPIGFTVEIKNTGSGAANGVHLSDPLPAGSGTGVTWTIDGSVGTPARFVLSGAKGSQTLSLASTTLPAGADYKVHIKAQTSETECSVYDNTATLTTTNGGNPNPVSAEESCAFRVDLAITKTGAPVTQELGQGNITWTMVVTNNGPDTDTNVKVSDPMPAGNTYVSSTTTQGTCTGGAILNCDLGTMAAGASVTITLVTTPSAVGIQTNTATVSGDRPETNLANNVATASVEVAPFQQLPCVLISKITPGQLVVGRKTTLTVHLTQGHNAAAGFKVHIQGAGINVVTKRSNARGVIKHTLKMKRKGILRFTPVVHGATASCGAVRVGVRAPFTPPVTG